jgi:hypothetical protein
MPAAVPSTQSPPVQSNPGAQTTAQPPQLNASLPVVTVQPVPHGVSALAQADAQTLLLQTCPGWHEVAQPPQWFASGAMQAPLQTMPDRHWHAPAWQTCPVEQGRPQPPQFSGSTRTPVHCEPQAT